MCENNKKLPGLVFVSSGNVMITCVTSLMLICAIFCIIQYSVNLRIANQASIWAEDGLSASCIAGLAIDLQRFKETYVTGKADVVVKDASQSYSIFKSSLNINLNSDSNRLLQNIKVGKYIVYNIYLDRTFTGSDKKLMDIYFFDENGLVNEVHKPYEDVYTPNGIKVTKTSVYADILFDLDIFGKRKINCHKQLLTQAYKR